VIALYLSAAFGAVAVLAGTVFAVAHLLGRHIADVEEDLATWLMRDAAGWRARTAKKAAVAKMTAKLDAAA